MVRVLHHVGMTWSVAVCLFLLTTGVRADERLAPFKDDGAPLPDNAMMEKLAKEDPVAFLENALRKMSREVKGYSMVMEKQERIDGTLNPREMLEVHFREKPFSVYMKWLEGARKAERVVYVEGENKGMMLARPAGRLARALAGDVVARDPDSAEAKASGRYPLTQFGLKKALERTWRSWKAAEEKGALKYEYIGVQKPKEINNRPCWVLRRTIRPPDKDGAAESTLYFDMENWIQVGSVVKGEKGQQVGTYYFRDLRLNPDLKDKQFAKSALTP